MTLEITKEKFYCGVVLLDRTCIKHFVDEQMIAFGDESAELLPAVPVFCFASEIKKATSACEAYFSAKFGDRAVHEILLEEMCEGPDHVYAEGLLHYELIPGLVQEALMPLLVRRSKEQLRRALTFVLETCREQT